MDKSVVLAFSGGLDTSWCVPVLQEQGYRVLAVTVDVGSLGKGGVAHLEEQARALKVDGFKVVDAKQPFFDRVLRYLIAGNVLRGGTYPLCVGAERSLQAQVCAQEAKKAGAQAVAHGCTAAGNDQVRFEVALRTFAPDLAHLAPVRDLAPTRAEQLALLQERGLPVPSHGATYSVNEGLWGVTIGGAETKTTDQPLPPDAWVWTKGAEASSPAPKPLKLAFEAGVPTAIDGEELDPVTLIERLNETAAEYGVGRGIHLGETILGMKGRVAFEAPAATVLITAHRELEKLVLTQRQLTVKDAASRLYGDWLHEGQWTDPACRDIEALLDQSQTRVSGEVELELRPWSCFVSGVRSPFSLHAASRSVYGETALDWTPAEAKGFARILAMPSELHSKAGGQA